MGPQFIYIYIHVGGVRIGRQDRTPGYLNRELRIGHQNFWIDHRIIRIGDQDIGIGHQNRTPESVINWAMITKI